MRFSIPLGFLKNSALAKAPSTSWSDHVSRLAEGGRGCTLGGRKRDIMRVFLVRLNEPDGFDLKIGFMRDFVRGEKNKKGQQRGLVLKLSNLIG